MRTNLDNLQALRGVACLAVVLYHQHQWETNFPTAPAFFAPFRWFGYAGVDLFFVISGFIIAHSNCKRLGQPRELGTYLFRRFWRLYPLYWIALGIAVLIMHKIFKQDLKAMDWSGNAVCWFGLWPGIHHFMPHAWTLTFEMLFYVAFGVLFLLPLRIGIGLLGLWGAAALAVTASGWQSPSRFVHTVTLPYVLEFLAGAIVSWIVRRNWTGYFRPAMVFALAWAAIAGVLVNDRNSEWLAQYPRVRIVVFGLPAALIVYALVSAEFHGRWRMPNWAKGLGNASYSVYLMHMPLGFAMMAWTQKWSHGWLAHLGWSLAMLAVCIGGGLLLYRLAEKPLMDLVKKKQDREIAKARIPFRNLAFSYVRSLVNLRK